MQILSKIAPLVFNLELWTCNIISEYLSDFVTSHTSTLSVPANNM